MKRFILTLTLLATMFFTIAQPPQSQRGSNPSQTDQLKLEASNSLQLDINTLEPAESQRINNFIDEQRHNRSFWSTMGTIGIAALNTIVTQTTGIGISEVMNLIETPKKQEAEWNQMIQNECNYEESLTYINNLTDFYSKGTSNGALDPSDFNFNGFTLNAQHNGKDVLRFYCHVDTDDAGLNEIINHSKFCLVLDSMYFYPYHCHLPNMKANNICPEPDRTYERNVSFNFEERENLMVSISFTITSSWYNQAIMLAKDVELGTFSVQVPIDPNHLIDSVFVYKRMPHDTLRRITGSCFIVPRSYMPLTGGAPHWGTGEYNVKVTVAEHCSISKELRNNWKEDYRHIKKMKKKQQFWPAAKDYCIQQGTSLLRCSLQTATTTAIKQWDWINSAGGGMGSSTTGNGNMNIGGGMPNGGGKPSGL